MRIDRDSAPDSRARPLRPQRRTEARRRHARAAVVTAQTASLDRFVRPLGDRRPGRRQSAPAAEDELQDHAGGEAADVRQNATPPSSLPSFGRAPRNCSRNQ